MGPYRHIQCHPRCPGKARCYNRGMKVSTKRLPDSQVLLEIEADEQQMERSLDKAFRRLSQRVEVPGFRKGKAPAGMLERHIGRARVVREALDILIPEAYNQAIEEQDVDAIDRPSIELVTDEPLAFKATVPVRPTVELGEYNSVRVKREPVSIDEGEVDKALEELRHRYAVHEPAERPVQLGDIVRADVRGVIDGREVYKEDDAELRLREGAAILLPGIAEGRIAAEKGTPKEIAVTVPEGERPLSGKSGTFTVNVKEVEQYLANTRRTRDELNEELLPIATDRVRRSLALTRLAEQEEIKAENQEVDAEVDRLAGSAGEQADQLRKLFGSPDGRAAIARSLVTRKTMDRLTEIATRDGTTAPEKKSRRKPAKAAAK